MARTGQDARKGVVEAQQAQEGRDVVSEDVETVESASTRDFRYPASAEEHRGIALTEYLWLADGRPEQIEPLFDDLSAVCRKHGVAWLGGETKTNTGLRDGFPWQLPPTPAADPAAPSAPEPRWRCYLHGAPRGASGDCVVTEAMRRRLEEPTPSAPDAETETQRYPLPTCPVPAWCRKVLTGDPSSPCKCAPDAGTFEDFWKTVRVPDVLPTNQTHWTEAAKRAAELAWLAAQRQHTDALADRDAELERLRGLVAYFVHCADERMWPTKRMGEARLALDAAPQPPQDAPGC